MIQVHLFYAPLQVVDLVHGMVILRVLIYGTLLAVDVLEVEVVEIGALLVRARVEVGRSVEGELNVVCSYGLGTFSKRMNVGGLLAAEMVPWAPLPLIKGIGGSGLVGIAGVITLCEVSNFVEFIKFGGAKPRGRRRGRFARLYAALRAVYIEYAEISEARDSIFANRSVGDEVDADKAH